MPISMTEHLPQPPADPTEFEQMTAAAVNLIFPEQIRFELYGRSGQAQQGVDIYRASNLSGITGIQCKNTVKALTTQIMDSEIQKASSFIPPLNALYFATTLPRNAQTQEAVRLLSLKNTQQGLFVISILFWDDIIQALKKDGGIFYSFYPHLRPIAKQDLSTTHDQQLLNLITAKLPYEGVIKQLQNMTYPGKVYSDVVPSILNDFYYEFDTPKTRFCNPTLEKLRMQLRLDIETFFDPLGQHYTSIPGTKTLAFTNYTDHAYLLSVTNEFNIASSKIANTYLKLTDPAIMPK